MGGESTRCVSWTRSPRARADPRTSRAVPGAHSRVWAVACRLGFLANAVRFRGSASALPSLTAPSLREPAPPSPRSLYVRGIILGYKRYVDGPTAEPLPRVARRARRERRKTRRVFLARDARLGGDRDDRRETRNAGTMACREPFASRSGVALPPEHTRAVLSNVDAAFRRGLRPSMSMVVRTGRAGDGGWRMEDGGWRLAAAARGALRRSFGFLIALDFA
jgi:hypothetical protein